MGLLFFVCSTKDLKFCSQLNLQRGSAEVLNWPQPVWQSEQKPVMASKECVNLSKWVQTDLPILKGFATCMLNFDSPIVLVKIAGFLNLYITL